MQFILNLFGTVHATKDIGKQASGLYAIDEKLRVLSNHVDFLLQEHFSRPHQSCQVKTYDVYTSEDAGVSDREGGGSSAADENGREEEIDADIPAGDTETGRDRPVESETGAGSGEASACPSGANPSNSDGEGRREPS